MEKWQAWLLIALILGVIVSNIMVLKYTANYKMPQFGKPNLPKKPHHEGEDGQPEASDDQDGDGNRPGASGQ
ncbi:DUF2897 family protein [Ferrimonas sediminicola]|uniref:DUF2897 family protein n=1 Tax=Ferrimonas sediminicola TaxID=2569538 RepID=A0A4V6WMM9_9GAMM|nr:DUF2897 family protein [Ferrimonas sediminicola]TKB48242.1 DUF2897 family protein [Ferrimonas sediminicola]